MVDYGDLDPNELSSAIERIKKRLGGLATKQAIDAIENGNVIEAVRISLTYYDKTYRTAMVKMPRKVTVPLEVDRLSVDEMVTELRKLAAEIDIPN
jgi:tRNA 2-selenouridine synthase